MKVKPLATTYSGTWSRDCELLGISDCKGFKLSYHKDEDDTYWSLRCDGIIGYKLMTEEFSAVGYLLKLPIEGAFFEILDSLWIKELIEITQKEEILKNCKHYILQFYDETIEIIAKDFIFEQLNGSPII